jgi:hypothetical protein
MKSHAFRRGNRRAASRPARLATLRAAAHADGRGSIRLGQRMGASRSPRAAGSTVTTSVFTDADGDIPTLTDGAAGSPRP